MGCDIHLRVQKRVNGEWLFAESLVYDKWSPDRLKPEVWYKGRNYDLFAILANVRNGHGFAGCDTGDGFKPIADPRGLPNGLTEYEKDGEDCEFWFGDHSYSWLTLAELLAYDWSQETNRRGWVTAEVYADVLRMREWDRYESPKESCGGISGPNIDHVSAQEMERKLTAIDTEAKAEAKEVGDYWSIRKTKMARLERTYAVLQWPVVYAEAAGTFYTRTIPRLIKLSTEVGGPENVRIVFGFDS